MRADTPWVEAVIRISLADESVNTLWIHEHTATSPPPYPPLTVNDARCTIECLRENPRFSIVSFYKYDIHNPAVLNLFRNGLPLCTSLTTVRLQWMNLGNEELERLLPAFHNTSVTSLDLSKNNIQGQGGGEVLRHLLVGNNSLLELNLCRNPIGPEGTNGLRQGLASNTRLQQLYLYSCSIGNKGLANLLPADGMINNSLAHLNLNKNGIQGAEGGHQVTLLLRCFPQLKMLCLDNNPLLGPLGGSALSPGLTAAAACQLEQLGISQCGLGNDGVLYLIPDGQVNRSLTHLDLRMNNIQGLVGEENVVAFVTCCTNLDSVLVDENSLSLHRLRHHLDLLLDRKRLVTEASALGGSPPSVIFEKLVQANSHEQGLSASFVILRDYIFAEHQHTSSSTSEQKVHATGVKRKR